MIYFCSQQNRRALVLASQTIYGIDYVEVVGNSPCGTQLALTLLKDARLLTGAKALTTANFVIASADGSGPAISVVKVNQATNDAPFVLLLNLSASGNFSPYTLTLVGAAGFTDPPSGFDPQLSSVTFSFKAGCPSPADCLPDNCCPAPQATPPDINYLAKDYGGFRQTMLDRLSALIPAWTETHAADMGVTLVETLAYAADHLSYQQDAVSTEAYIGTARSRISLRRHARLVDYQIGEGSNARALIYMETTADNIALPAGTLFYVRVPGLPTAAKAGDPVARQLAKTNNPVFASLQPITLFTEQNSMDFYTWGDADCCLAPGATTATLVGNLTSLKAGDVLIFEEVVGPLTGNASDADPTHRAAVVLTGVRTTDDGGNALADPLILDPSTKKPQLITAITWAADDALTAPICLSSTTAAAEGSTPVFNVSVARGNVGAADHGVWIQGESLGAVPDAGPTPIASGGCSCGNNSAAPAAPLPRFYPELANSPLTFAVPFTGVSSANDFLNPHSSTATAQIKVSSDDGNTWTPLPDLLSSDDTKHVFVPEIESTGAVFLRFGDGQYGAAADAEVAFSAAYRVGNGSAGNVGRDSIAHIVVPQTFLPPLTTFRSTRNPVAAAGGVDPESMQHILQYAPFSYETQERCVTEADYGAAAASVSTIREARGTLRWTGSWYTAFVSIDPVKTLTSQLIGDTTTRLNQLRMMGTGIAVEGAVIVGLAITMQICVDSEHFQGDVYDALMHVFVTGNQCNGQPGLLNASNFSFGETVYASPLIAAAQAVEGVLSATLTQFAPMNNPAADGSAQGYLTMGRLQLPRCDNDPDHLNNGTFQLVMDGGK
jgi:hypothetical protein